MVEGGRKSVTTEELRAATEALVQQVATLSESLQTIGHLQERQRELAHEVKTVREDLTETAVPRHVFEKQVIEETNARLRQQTKLRKFALVMSMVSMLISLVAVFVSYEANASAIDSSNSVRIQVCEQRNADLARQAKASKKFFAPYLAQERRNKHADPVLTAILEAITVSTNATVPCR